MKKMPLVITKMQDQVEGLYDLSRLQQGILIHDLNDVKSKQNIRQLICDLVRPDAAIVKRSWAHLMRRHSILRSAFHYDEFNVPVRCVLSDVKLPVEFADFSDMSEGAKCRALQEYEAADASTGFDLATAPLMRVTLIRLNGDHYRMLWTAHQALFDSWSTSALLEEFLATYEHIARDEEVVAGENDNYEDYFSYIDGNIVEEQAYWRSYLATVDSGTQLPFVKLPEGEEKTAPSYKEEFLGADEMLTKKIENFAHRYGITVNTIMQGVWSYLLHHYTGNGGVAYGIRISCRHADLPEAKTRIGVYTNTVIRRTEVRKEQRIGDWLKKIEAAQGLADRYQHTPLNEINEWAEAHEALFDTLIVFGDRPPGKVAQSAKWSLRPRNIRLYERSDYPLQVRIMRDKQILLAFQYDCCLLREAQVKQIRDHFEHVLLQLVRCGEHLLKDITLLTAPEKYQLLHKFHDRRPDASKDETIISRFELQVQQAPDNIAVIFEGERLTYRELNERSNQLAHFLRGKGIRPEVLVPVCMERSPWMLVAILGILKAGGAYVPIDPDYPAERIAYMLRDTNAKIMLAGKGTVLSGLQNNAAEVIDIKEQFGDILRQSRDNPLKTSLASNVAYIIYTSGSTGQPKGVMVEHRQLVASTVTRNLYYKNINAAFLIPSFSFDSSVAVIFGIFLRGGTLLLSRNESMKKVNHLRKLLKRADTILCVPSYYEFLLNEGIVQDLTLSTVILAGESLSSTLVARHYNQAGHVALFNEYGPTECAVWSTVAAIQSGEKVTIGRPIANVNVYILDGSGELVPVGVAGEIHISGSGVARGYLNREELTRQKFVPDPFSSEAGARMYRTGDLGRWLPDGRIEFLGRSDDQVKIRGYRIEPAEIENTLLQSPLVQQGIVVALKDKEENNYLAGYVVATAKFEREAIISFLRTKLPDYMVPMIWVELPALPLTPNGKVDKKALPNPETAVKLSGRYAAPRSCPEKEMVVIWQNLLGAERVGIYDNFFEIGGHSILAIRLASTIRKELNLEISVKDIFNRPTIAQLAAIS